MAHCITLATTSSKQRTDPWRMKHTTK